MGRFDLYRARRGWLLDVQSDLIALLTTRVVIPLWPAARAPQPVRDLHPIFTIDGREFILLTHLMAAVPRAELGRPEGSLAHERDAITRALDLLFTGF